jgi:small subunit ribosomal protein S4e
MHLKRNSIGTFWAIPKKGNKYIARASHNQKEAIPLVVALRDIMKILKTRKELRSLLNQKSILINHRIVREENFPLALFDVLTLSGLNKHYKVGLSKNKKFVFSEISGKEAETKIYKIIGRKILKNKKIQINLGQGKNIISNEKADMGDSIILSFKDNKIVKIIKMEKNKTAFVIKGKHAGSSGKINEILERGGKQIAKISLDEERINVWTKNIIVNE